MNATKIGCPLGVFEAEGGRSGVGAGARARGGEGARRETTW